MTLAQVQLEAHMLTATERQKSTSKHSVSRPRDNPADSVLATSSVPPEIPEKQEVLFREVLALLDQKRIPFAVSGAFALQQHTGICRCTKDLDIFLTVEDTPLALT